MWLIANLVVDLEESSPLSDVHRPNKLSCSSCKSHLMTTRSQTGSLEPKCPTSYLAMSNDVMEPSCYSQATRYAHWRRAMQEEHNALLENGTWQLVPPSSSQNIIRSKWVLKQSLSLMDPLIVTRLDLLLKGIIKDWLWTMLILLVQSWNLPPFTFFFPQQSQIAGILRWIFLMLFSTTPLMKWSTCYNLLDLLI